VIVELVSLPFDDTATFAFAAAAVFLVVARAFAMSHPQVRAA
jgi:hypothetical protein